jgi:ribosomal protein S18 acetylase RimI-like enzyme
VADHLTHFPAGIELRPATHEDRDFLRELYASTRARELAPVPWTDAEKDAFVAAQFDAQDAAYRGAYPDGEFLVVLEQGKPLGRLYVGRLPGELRVIDVTLIPAQRGQGIGTALMRWVIGRADHDGLTATLHVEPWNPAKRLYERLGFATVELRGIYEFMSRPVSASVEDGLVEQPTVGRIANRDQEDLELAQVGLRQAVGALRQQWAAGPAED